MKRVTTVDIAEKLGVSPATVSLALNDDPRVAAETKRKVKQLANELKYSPNYLASSLRTRKTKVIGLILPSIANPFYPEIVWGVDQVAKEAGYNVLLCNTSRDPNQETELVRLLIRKQVDGIIFASMHKMIQSVWLEELAKSGIKAVCLNKQTHIPWIDSVSTDFLSGGHLATRHLIELGHRHIAYIGSKTSNRRAGYEKALQEAGIPVDPEIIRLFPNTDYQLDELTYCITRDLLRKHPEVTGIFAYNDLAAVGVIRAIKEHGLIIPRAISVIGFDDLFFARLTDPPLTTVWQPTFELGIQATKILLERINNPNVTEKCEIVHTPKLVIRGSTGVCMSID